jgi:curved DNA-binding protein CbpA
MSNVARVATHYDALGISTAASTDEIGDAELALRKVYEDRAHKGDPLATEMLRRLNEAREALVEEHARAAYDRKDEVRFLGFSDLAYSPSIAKVDKLLAIAEWMRADGDPVRAATSFDSALGHDVFEPSDLLDV